jgi:NAD+ kinase
MKVAIYGQYYHENSADYIKVLLDALADNNIEIFIEKGFHKIVATHLDLSYDLQMFESHQDLNNTFDLLFSIGGDGTILRAITYVRDTGIPILGINTGRLGFLATIQKEEIKDSIKQIVAKQFTIVERTLLQIETSPIGLDHDELNFALNEIAVSRKNTTSMITVETYLNDEYLTSYWADGLIISTPTGSTGYSLSCGGPVIMPSASSLVLTPIAPHNLNARPLVIPDNLEIKLKVYGREESYLVSLDSRIATLANETEITVRKAAFKINLVELADESFLKTLRNKLLWGEDKRN